MNEKEKMLNGYLYDCTGNDLLKERLWAKDLCHKYNSIKPSKILERQKIIRKLVGKIGDTFNIEPPFWCDYGYNIEVGDNFYVNHNCVILDCGKVKFGDNVFVGPNCGFYAAGHPLDVETRNKCIEFAHPITIGSNVWIGGNSCFMPGVSVGDNTVIGALSVVTKDIPAGVVAFGNPCRVLREIGEEDKKKYVKEM